MIQLLLRGLKLLSTSSQVGSNVKSKCGIDSELLSGKRGEFTVWYNGVAIADKKLEVCDVFPSHEEIADIILKLQQEN